MDVDIAKVQAGIEASLKALPMKQASDWRPRYVLIGLIGWVTNVCVTGAAPPKNPKRIFISSLWALAMDLASTLALATPNNN